MAVQDVEYRQADTQSSFLGALGMLSSSHSSVDFAGKVDLTGQAHSSPCRITHCLSVPEITDVAVHDVLGTIISSWTPNRLSRTLLEQVPLPRLTPTQPSVFSLATHVLKAQLVNLTSRLRSLEAENSSLNKDNTTIMAENSNLRCTNTILVSDLSTLNGELTKLRENNEKAIQTDKFKEDEANLQEDAWLDRKNSEPSPPMSEADLTLVDRSFATHDFEFLEDATTNLTKNFETKESHQDEQHRNVLNLASISTSPSTVMSSSTSTNTKTNTAATAAKEPLINVRINRPRSRTYPIPTLRRIATKTQQQPIRIPSAVKEIHKRKASSSRKLTTSHIRSSTLSPSDSASPSTSTSMVSSFSVSLNSGFSFKDQDKDRIHTDAKSRATMKTMKLKSKSSEDQAPGSENEKGVSTPPSSPTPHLRISPTLDTPGSHRTSPGSGSDFVKPLSLKPQKLNVPSPTRVARATVPASPIPRPPRSPHRPVSTLRIPLRSPARRRSRSTSRTRNANTSSTTNTPAKKRPALQALDVNASKPRVANGSKTMPPKVKPLRPKRSAKDLGKRRGVILTERLQGLASPTKDADGTKTSPHPLKDVAPAKRQDSCQTALASTNSVSTDSLQTELASVDSMCSVVRTDGHSSEDAYSDLDGDRKVKDAQLNVKRHDKPDSDKQQDNNPKDMATDNAASAKLCSSVLASLERICAAFSGSDLGSLEMTISEEGEGVVEEDVFESAVVGGGGAKKTGEEQSQTVTKERQVAVAAESAGAGVDEDSEDQEGDETLRIAASDLSRTVGLSRSLSLLPQIRRALMLESECGDSEEEDLDLDLDSQLKSTTDTTEDFFADSARASACRPSTPATKSKSRISVRSMIWSASTVSGSTPRRAPDLSPAKLLAYDKPSPSILSSSSSSSTSLASQSSSSDASVGSPTTFSPRARKLSRSKLQLPPMVLGSTAPRVGHVACASPPRPSNQTEPVERPKIGGSRSGVSPRSKDPASSAIARSPRSPPCSSSGNLKTVPSPSKAQIKTSPKKTATQRSPPRKSAIAAPRPVIFPVRKPQNPAKTGTEPRVSIGRNLLRHLPIGASTKITKPASKPPIAPAPAASAAQKSFLAPPTALLAPPSPETQIRSQTQAQTKPRSHTVNTISPLSPALSTPSQQALDDAAAAKKPRSNTVNTYSPVRSSPLAQSVVNAVRASRDSMSMRMRGKPGGTGGDGVGRTPGGQVPPVVSPTTLTVPSANTSPSAAPTTKGGTAPLRIAKKTAVAHAKPSTPAPPPASPQMSTASTTKRLQPPATSPNKVHLHPDDEAPPTAAFMRPKASAPSKDNIRTKRMTNSIAPLIPNWSPGAAPARCKGIFRNSLSMVR
ncbi:unnamed protein product [Cyclocybe aegerita]|uniref:Uncharacterized protein n=1 Tax=Cyclocybe aegerita TaxID=1973307 RepID=A0A8S0XGM1_CYCAE|nr:unnamed protein product [Cyclocybe aegerita]